jgi:hypothetical protein
MHRLPRVNYFGREDAFPSGAKSASMKAQPKPGDSVRVLSGHAGYVVNPEQIIGAAGDKSEETNA